MPHPNARHVKESTRREKGMFRKNFAGSKNMLAEIPARSVIPILPAKHGYCLVESQIGRPNG
jgi:hypothetical protein